jgi:RNA polymerase sigma-70 factor (ECF subfamily)
VHNSNNNNSNEWLDELIEDTEVGLASYVRRIVNSPDDVPGVMQDAYLKVFLALRDDHTGAHKPVALLYRTARNTAISRLRHQKVVRHSVTAIAVAEELRAEPTTAEQAINESEKLDQLMLVVNHLPPKCRDVFVLRWIHGLSQRAIGERLGITVSTIEKHLAKGLRFCRKELSRNDAGDSLQQDSGCGSLSKEAAS